MKKELVRLGGIAAVLVAVLLVAAGFYTRSQKQEQAARTASATAGQSSAALARDSAFVRPHSRSLGPANAPVTLVEFLDPECESCRAMYPVTKHLLSEYGNKLRLVVRYLPLHPNSMQAVGALEAAGEQGKYWEMLETLFLHQPRWGDHHNPRPELIPQLAEQIGLDMEAYRRSLEAGAFRKPADIDRADAQTLGITATPTFFINGKRVASLGYEPLKVLIDQELKGQ
jgi:protein-disulfide isomerase